MYHITKENQRGGKRIIKKPYVWKREVSV